MTYYQYINIFVDYCGENGQYTNKNDAHMICMSVSQIKLNYFHMWHNLMVFSSGNKLKLWNKRGKTLL